MSTPPTIPDHTLLRPIGRGAYGEVWLARNVMGAPRAVKIIWRGQFESDRPYEREFAGIQRYEPVSRSADGLVHVLHVGRNDAEGYFYYVMELADDLNDEPRAHFETEDQKVETCRLIAYQPKTLRNVLKRIERLPTIECLRLGLDVCGGLAQLHRKGLVHRDVKPGNIIFVHGRAKLADIGLVSAGGEGRTFVGTEGYIPPEGPGSPSADLYALGIVLYEAATGYAPDRFPDVPAEWFRDDATEDALELHEVISKACESQRGNRYETAEAMHADLALLQSGQSVRRVRALELRAVWARRIGWAAALVAAFAVVGFLFAAWRARVAERTSATETALRQRAEAAEQDARERLYNAYVAEARATVLSGDVGRRFRTFEAVRQAATIHKGPELRREAFAALALPDLRLDRSIQLDDRINYAWIDPTFTRFAAAVFHGDVEIYSMRDRQLLQTLTASRTDRSAQALRFSPEGRYLAFRRNNDLEVWDLTSTQRVVLARRSVTDALSFHPRLPRLLAGRPSGRLVTWDLTTGKQIASWPQLAQQWTLVYSPEGDRFAMSSDQGSGGLVEVRDATNGSVLASASFGNVVRGLTWHPNGRHIAAPCADRTVSLMDAQTGALRLLGKHKAQAVSADFSPSGDFVFGAGWDGEVNVWNTRTLERELTAPLAGTYLRFSPDERQMAYMGKNGCLMIYEFSQAAEYRELSADLQLTVRGTFSADGRWLALPMPTSGVAIWDLSRPTEPPAIGNVGEGLGLVSFGPEDTELFGWSDETLFQWRLTERGSNALPGLELRSRTKGAGHINSAHLLSASRMVLTTGEDGIYLAPLGHPVSKAGIRRGEPHWRSAVSPDEKWLASGFSIQRYAHGEKEVRIFRLPDLTPHCWLTNSAEVLAMAFSPKGDTLAVVTIMDLCLWDTRTWQKKRTRPATADHFARVDYSADGQILIFSENARSAALLDANTLEALLPLPLWTHPVTLTADNSRLAVLVEGRRVQVWDLAAVRTRFRELGIDW